MISQFGNFITIEPRVYLDVELRGSNVQKSGFRSHFDGDHRGLKSLVFPAEHARQSLKRISRFVYRVTQNYLFPKDAKSALRVNEISDARGKRDSWW